MLFLLFACNEITPLSLFSHCTLSFCILASTFTSSKTIFHSHPHSHLHNIKLCNAQLVTIVLGISSTFFMSRNLSFLNLPLRVPKTLSMSTHVELWSLLNLFSSRVTVIAIGSHQIN